MRRIVQFVVGIIGIGCLLASIWILRPPAETYFWDRLFDTGHILVFGLVVLFLLWVVDALLPRMSQPLRYGLSGLVAIGLGLAVELVQGAGTGRTGELVDLLNDLVGVVAFALLHAAVDPRLSDKRSGILRPWWLAGTALAVLLLGLAPFLHVCLRYYMRNQLFPIVVAFDEPWHENFCYVSASHFRVVPAPPGWPQEAHSRALVARIHSSGVKYPGLIVSEPYPDWRGYRILEIDLYLEDSEPRHFVLRVHDSQHDQRVTDRFRASLNLRPGFQTVRCDLQDIRKGPEDRELSLSQVDGVGLFAVDAARPLTFYVGEMRLVK